MPPKEQLLAQPLTRIERREPALRLVPEAPEEGAAAPLDPRQYQAVRLGRRPPRLRIRTHVGPGHSLPYSALADVVSDDRFGASFALIFYHQVVQVRGRNLGPVVEAINSQMAAGLTAYDPQAFDAPQTGDPVIEEVEFREK